MRARVLFVCLALALTLCSSARTTEHTHDLLEEHLARLRRSQSPQQDWPEARSKNGEAAAVDQAEHAPDRLVLKYAHKDHATLSQRERPTVTKVTAESRAAKALHDAKKGKAAGQLRKSAGNGHAAFSVQGKKQRRLVRQPHLSRKSTGDRVKLELPRPVTYVLHNAPPKQPLPKPVQRKPVARELSPLRQKHEELLSKARTAAV